MEDSQAEIRRVLKINTTNRNTFLGLKFQGTMYEEETIVSPSWEQVLNAVNLMGKDRLKNIELDLHVTTDASEKIFHLQYFDKENSGFNWGYGVLVSLEREGYYLFNPERENGDQFFENYIEGSTDFGFELVATAVDYNLMLQATKFFYDSGHLDPTLNWWDFDDLRAKVEQYSNEWWADVHQKRTPDSL